MVSTCAPTSAALSRFTATRISGTLSLSRVSRLASAGCFSASAITASTMRFISSGGTEACSAIHTGFELAFCPSEGGLVAKARTPGSLPSSGPSDSTICCCLRSRSPQGLSRVKEMPCESVGRPETTK